MMTLFLFNTLTKDKTEFVPIDPELVRMYVCGPTVYDRAHLGNARPVVVFDVLFRVLKMLYPHVVYVRNITDVDDKINAAAKETGEPIRSLTDRTIAFFHQDMHALNALSPTREPRATDHIPQMIHMIETLIKKEMAYAREGHVLFRHKKHEGYGKLSRRSLDELVAGARIEVAPYKEHGGDFVLWKPSLKDEPGWKSPWGVGRPGWHIECSAMSAAYLGETFDIHGGGIDLVFPHHENELAQSCAAHGNSVMANYWMHNGHLMVEGAKMSKSLGNFLTVQDLLHESQGEVIRYALLSTHYRQPIDFSKEHLSSAKKNLDKLYRAWGACVEAMGDDVDFHQDSSCDEETMSALLDDLNTPLACMHLQKLASICLLKRDIKVMASFKNTARLLGFLAHDPATWFQGGDHRPTGLSEEDIEKAIEDRLIARQSKDFFRADNIRKELELKGIILEDSSKGTTWRKV